MSWLLTHIATQNSAGTTTVTTDVPGGSTSSRTEGGATETSLNTRVAGTGTRTTVRSTDNDGLGRQKSHYAMKVSMRIPVHNKQPISSE